MTGGRHNTASGYASSVTGGGGANAPEGNEAFANYSVVSGEWRNLAGDPAKIDRAVGEQASVSGGYSNTASADYASVSGGSLNTASASYASVSGGYYRSASGTYD